MGFKNVHEIRIFNSPCIMICNIVSCTDMSQVWLHKLSLVCVVHQTLDFYHSGECYSYTRCSKSALYYATDIENIATSGVVRGGHLGHVSRVNPEEIPCSNLETIQNDSSKPYLLDYITEHAAILMWLLNLFFLIIFAILVVGMPSRLAD